MLDFYFNFYGNKIESSTLYVTILLHMQPRISSLTHEYTFSPENPHWKSHFPSLLPRWQGDLTLIAEQIDRIRGFQVCRAQREKGVTVHRMHYHACQLPVHYRNVPLFKEHT